MRHILIPGLAVLVAALAAGCGAGRPAEPDLQVITHGEAVDLAAHLANGKYTVVDFYAAWCPPCRALGPALERMAARESGRMALRKVDIVDWTMPVVEQYGIESLPHLMLYDPEGRRIGNGDDVFQKLGEIFGDAAREVNEIGGGAEPESPPENAAAHKTL